MLYLNAFWELSSDRPAGMGVSAIPFTSIHTYATSAGIEGDDFAFFLAMIRAMDTTVVAHLREPGAGDAGAKAAPARKLTPGLFEKMF